MHRGKNKTEDWLVTVRSLFSLPLSPDFKLFPSLFLTFVPLSHFPPFPSSVVLSVWPSHLRQWHLMWSGSGPRAYSHWLIKTHMRTEDLMWRERSGLVSEGLITHSHWVACSLSHTWLSECVCEREKCDHGCDFVGVCRRRSLCERDILHLSGDWCVKVCVSESVHSWLVNIRLADDRFGSGDTHIQICIANTLAILLPEHVV